MFGALSDHDLTSASSVRSAAARAASHLPHSADDGLVRVRRKFGVIVIVRASSLLSRWWW